MCEELLDRRERKSFDVMFHSEAQYENHESISLLALKCLPIISGRLSLGAAQMIFVEQGAE